MTLVSFVFILDFPQKSFQIIPDLIKLDIYHVKSPYLVLRSDSAPPAFILFFSFYLLFSCLHVHAGVWLLSPVRHIIQLVANWLQKEGGRSREAAQQVRREVIRASQRKIRNTNKETPPVFPLCYLDKTDCLLKTLHAQTGRSESQLLWLHWNHLHLGPPEII